MSWRGIGAFLLFVILYMVISPAVGMIAIYVVDNFVVHKLIDFFPGNRQTAVRVISSGLGSLGGMSLAIIAHTAIMEERPARRVGVAFILLQAVYALMFLLAEPDFTNPLVVEALVACIVAWVAFRLPPLKQGPPLSSNTVWWARVVGSAGVVIVVITVFVIIAVDR